MRMLDSPDDYQAARNWEDFVTTPAASVVTQFSGVYQ